MTDPTIPDLLRGFEPFDRLADADLVVLAARTELRNAPAGRVLFESGDQDPWIVCLYEGTLMLATPNGHAHRIDAGTPGAAVAVSRLKPRQYTAVAATPVRYLRIDERGLGDLQSLPKEANYVVREIDGDDDPIAPTGPAAEFVSRVDPGSMTLPSLPAIALQATRVIDRDEADTATLAKVVMTDPSIAAKLIRAANSAIFYGRGEVQTCERAVARLGLDTTRQLVVAFALRELFHTDSPALRKRMEGLWVRATKVAAIAFVLARELGGFDADEAQLAGLLHDIGTVPVLNYAAENPHLANDAERLEYLCSELSPVLGERMLTAWNFPPQLVRSARDARQWWRDPGPEAELADLVLVAHLTSWIETPQFTSLPPMVRLPAFRKVAGDRLGPDTTLSVLAQAKSQIRELELLLRR